MSNQELVLKKKHAKGDDNFKTFTVRVPKDLVDKLDNLSIAANYSRNELISILLDYAIEHCSVDEK